MNAQEFLEDRGIEFDVIQCPDPYDPPHQSQTVLGSDWNVAKTVLLKADHGYAYIVAILPARARADLAKISATMGGSKIEFATEFDIETYCPDSEYGALLPFGTHYALKTLVDESLVDAGRILFKGTSHQEAIRMRYEDFQRLESPLVADFAIRPEEVA